MIFGSYVRTAAALAILAALPGAAAAQAAWTPGSEVVGQPIQVTTNGVTNTVFLDAGGGARLVSARGRTVPGSWSATGGQLCLNNGAASECWPYASPFRAGAPVTLTSSCHATSTWLAEATNTPASPAERGERGR
jgi:hypothetical protein